jgi:hypothetical protein
MSQPTDDAVHADEETVNETTVPGSDGGPVDEGDMADAEGLTTSPQAAKHYEDMLERGAHHKGEGRMP